MVVPPARPVATRTGGLQWRDLPKNAGPAACGRRPSAAPVRTIVEIKISATGVDATSSAIGLPGSAGMPGVVEADEFANPLQGTRDD